MKIENLHVGQRVANYRKLCELLEEPAKNGGTAKAAQIKQWELHFSFERDKNAFIIKEIFDTPAVSTDGRMRFARYAEQLLLNYLWNAHEEWEKTEVEQTPSQWCVELGLASGRVYDEEVKDGWTQRVPDEAGFPPIIVQHISYQLAQKCKEILFSTARSLNDRGIVQVEERFYVVKKLVHRKAEVDEAIAIQRAKERALEELDCNYFAVAVSPTRRKKYEAILSRIYQEEHGWDKVYMLLAISLNSDEDAAKYRDVDLEELKDDIRREIKRSIKKKLEKELGKSTAKEDAIWEGAEFRKNSYSMSEMDKNAMLFLLDDLI